MAKKKVTTKKKVVAPKLKHEKFSLDVRTHEDAQTLVNQMTMLKVSAGWNIISKMMEGSMAAIERSIITKVDADGKALSESDMDTLRQRLIVFDEILKKPDSLIAQFTKQSPMHMPSYDPYHMDYKQMMKEPKEHIEEDSPSTLRA